MTSIEDDYFGLLQWDTDFKEWRATITLLPYGEVFVGVPPEYVDSHEVRKHIQETMRIIERDELGFREQAANELFVEGGFALFLKENQEFNHEQFVNDMHIGGISFTPNFPDEPLILSYEYGEGLEHGILSLLHGMGCTNDVEYKRLPENLINLNLLN